MAQRAGTHSGRRVGRGPEPTRWPTLINRTGDWPNLPGMAVAGVYREVAEAASAWVLDQVRGDDGPWLPADVPADAEPDPTPTDLRDSVHLGIGGLALLLTEGLDVAVVDRPDQWWAVPERLRTSGRER